MGREDDIQLKAAKRGFKEASVDGHHEEAARWANVIGDILKRRGEYVEALRWLRIDYDVSVKYLPQKQLLPTCQSLGEVYLRLGHFKEALIYQKKHLELAKDSEDLIEQQRASTQLGRTYHEMFLRSENDHYAIRNAKKYFRSAMKLARTIKQNPSCHKASHFLKEYVDAHNNLGMLEKDLDNIEEAQKILLQGLKICDEEEVSENDDARSRLHHNLGSLYLELRQWCKARQHMENDILICKRIEHLQGEAKGFINLGELHYRLQKYDEAIRCYQKALDIAKSMEDEDELVEQICQNIEVVKEAMQVLKDLVSEERKLEQLILMAANCKEKPNERSCLLKQNACLDRLIEKSSTIFAWQKHLEFAKRKKNVSKQLCDVEKKSDSYLAIGESYQKIRDFSKARKWYMKSWNDYRSIGNLEGQALAKINIGEILDSSGDWAGALEAFKEGYRIAVQGNLLSVQLSALDNMHYSNMIRFDNVEEARKLLRDIQKLKFLLNEEDVRNFGNEYCSETETETEEVDMLDNISDECNVMNSYRNAASKPKTFSSNEELDDDVPLVSLIQPIKNSSKTEMLELDPPRKKTSSSQNLSENSSSSFSKSVYTQPRKRVHVVISDDEVDENDKIDLSRGRRYGRPIEDLATSYGGKRRDEPNLLANREADSSHSNATKDALRDCIPAQLDESTCSLKSKCLKSDAKNGMESGCFSDAEDANTSKLVASGSTMDHDNASGHLLQSQDGECFHLPQSKDDYVCTMPFKVIHEVIYVDVSSCMDGGNMSTECMKVEVACAYYLQVSEEKRSKGLLPVIQDLKFCGEPLDYVEPAELFKDHGCEKGCIEVTVGGWVPKRLMKLYIDSCQKKSEVPNMKLLRKLYNLEVSEDEVLASGCGLQDVSVSPLLDALHEHKTVAVLDLSHNLLGNETMEKLQQIFTSSKQRYGGLTLNLHCNRFGPTALFQICECPVLLTRLEVLNLSENRLTDACGSYLSTILMSCKSLYSLNIEQCSITSRTIQKVADALDDGCVLSHLYIGKNNPISGNTMVNLFTRLSTLKRFQELSLSGIKLNKPVVERLCQLARYSSLSGLILGKTYIGSDAAVQLTDALSSGPQELVKFDLSYCGLTAQDFTKVCANISQISCILELNLSGNSIGEEGYNVLGSALVNPLLNLKVLIIDKCHLGLGGIVHIMHGLAENDSLEELHAADNVDTPLEATLRYDLTVPDRPKPSCDGLGETNVVTEFCAVNSDCNNLEVADSEDELIKGECTLSGFDGSCASSCQRNPFAGCQLIQELTTSIGSAKQLRLLDLSRNGFSPEAVATLFTAWSLSHSRCGTSVFKHVEDQTVHFSVEGKKCCGIEACCKINGLC